MRSVFFVPSHIQKFINKAKELDADILVFDLEDSVPATEKRNARNQCIAHATHREFKNPILLRINPIGSNDFNHDIDTVLRCEADGIICPKIETPDDILQLEIELDRAGCNKDIAIFPLIETPKAVVFCYKIAISSKKIKGMIFGHEDFLNNIRGLQGKNYQNLLFARSTIVMVCRAIGITPIDTPYLDIKNIDGCYRHAFEGRSLGFDGMLVLHPAQVEPANMGYTPNKDEIIKAQSIVRESLDNYEKGRTISFNEGHFIAPPTIKQAQTLLNRVKDIGCRDE